MAAGLGAEAFKIGRKVVGFGTGIVAEGGNQLIRGVAALIAGSLGSLVGGFSGAEAWSTKTFNSFPATGSSFKAVSDRVGGKPYQFGEMYTTVSKLICDGTKDARKNAFNNMLTSIGG